MATQSDLENWYEAGYRWFRFIDENGDAYVLPYSVGRLDLGTCVGPVTPNWFPALPSQTPLGLRRLSRRERYRARCSGSIDQWSTQFYRGRINAPPYAGFFFAEMPPVDYKGEVSLAPFLLVVPVPTAIFNRFGELPYYRWFNPDMEVVPIELEPYRNLTIKWPDERTDNDDNV